MERFLSDLLKLFQFLSINHHHLKLNNLLYMQDRYYNTCVNSAERYSKNGWKILYLFFNLSIIPFNKTKQYRTKKKQVIGNQVPVSHRSQLNFKYANRTYIIIAIIKHTICKHGIADICIHVYLYLYLKCCYFQEEIQNNPPECKYCLETLISENAYCGWKSRAVFKAVVHSTIV